MSTEYCQKWFLMKCERVNKLESDLKSLEEKVLAYRMWLQAFEDNLRDSPFLKNGTVFNQRFIEIFGSLPVADKHSVVPEVSNQGDKK
jgi:hypothetical protein